MINDEIKLDESAVDLLKDTVGGGTTVTANPELSGDEEDLTGLEVGDTKYKVPQGGGSAQHYHRVVLQAEMTPEYCFATGILLDVYINTQRDLTVADIWNYIRTNGPIFIQTDDGMFGTIYYDVCYHSDPLFDEGGILVNDIAGRYGEPDQLLSTNVNIAYDEYI